MSGPKQGRVTGLMKWRCSRDTQTKLGSNLLCSIRSERAWLDRQLAEKNAQIDELENQRARATAYLAELERQLRLTQNSRKRWRQSLLIRAA